MGKTERSYEEGIAAYKRRNRAVDEREALWLLRAFADLPRQARIFEIGSGTAERSDFLETTGLLVQRSDVSQAFLDILKKRSYQLKPVSFDLREDQAPRMDCFFASAVLLHFSYLQLPSLVEKLQRALLPGGRLVATFKEGQGEGFESRDGMPERFFSYQSEESLQELFSSWQEVRIERSPGETTWLQVVAFA